MLYYYRYFFFFIKRNLWNGEREIFFGIFSMKIDDIVWEERIIKGLLLVFIFLFFYYKFGCFIEDLLI